MANKEKIDISENSSETLYVSREEYTQVYEASKPAVESWKNTFESYVQENQAKVNAFYERASRLYGCEAPKLMRVALVFNPNQGNMKGEPIDNLTGVNPALEKQADVIYWVPEPDDFMTSPARIDKHIRGVLHEGEHRYFQGNNGNLHNEGFNAFLTEIDRDSEISALREKLFGTDTGYLEPTNELITVYLESLFDIALPAKSQTRIEFINEEELSFNILMSAMHYQDSDYPDSPTTKGPYAKLRKGYRTFSSKVLNRETGISGTEDANEATGGAKAGKMKVSPYDFRGKLPTDLLEEYVSDNKSIDKEFVLRLYTMAIEETNKIN